MKYRFIIYILAALFSTQVVVASGVKSTKAERNLIREGNKLYNEKRFADAEVVYKKALQENKDSELAAFNLATSLLRQSGSTDPNSKNNPLNKATEIFNTLSTSAQDADILAKSFYNLGNIAFNQEQYEQSIANYKKSLKANPNDDKARQNLRLAQLKLKQQEQEKDKNKDKKDDKDKDQDKDKQQDKQDQNKDQNKDQDKKDQQQNQDQNKDQNKDKQQPQPQEGGMSQDNIDQILKTMQNGEKATQQKVNAAKMKEQENSRRKTRNQW